MRSLSPCTHQEYFFDVVKDRRRSKNGVEFLIGWSDFPNIKYDTWEPITNLQGSEHMIALQEFSRLVRMTRQYLTVPATSVSPERLFSSVGLVKSELRGRLLDTTLIDVIRAKKSP